MKIFLIFLLLFTTLLSSTKFEETYLLYKSGDFTSSFKIFKTLAEDEDDLDAAYILAYMYENGEGCKVDRVQAATWYKISSRGYYYMDKDNSDRDINKEKIKIYKSLEKSQNIETNKTIQQYLQSLYNIKAHDANYFLPFSYRNNGLYPPTNGHDAKRVETEFQFSIKYDFSANLFGVNEVYTAAYTQLSFWQFYSESAYFRESNYNPELFVTFPISSLHDTKFIKALRLSFAHESNGRGGEEERSWNYLSVSTYFQLGVIFSELKLWHRLPDTTDYNPELIDYMGHGHFRFMFPYKKHMTQLLLRNNFSGESAVELNYTHPAFGRNDLFFYLKGFSGYGESLIDYDNRVDKLGFGFSISR